MINICVTIIFNQFLSVKNIFSENVKTLKFTVHEGQYSGHIVLAKAK